MLYNIVRTCSRGFSARCLVLFNCYVSARCVVFDCYVSARYLTIIARFRAIMVNYNSTHWYTAQIWLVTSVRAVLCVVFDCYVSARCLFLCFIVTLVRAVLFVWLLRRCTLSCVWLFGWYAIFCCLIVTLVRDVLLRKCALSCVVFECSVASWERKLLQEKIFCLPHVEMKADRMTQARGTHAYQEGEYWVLARARVRKMDKVCSSEHYISAYGMLTTLICLVSRIPFCRIVCGLWFLFQQRSCN